MESDTPALTPSVPLRLSVEGAHLDSAQISIAAPVGMERAGLRVLAARWAEALEAAGARPVIWTPPGVPHPDERSKFATEVSDLGGRIANWCGTSTDRERLLLAGVPSDVHMARDLINHVAEAPDRTAILWESPGVAVLDLADRLGIPGWAARQTIVVINPRHHVRLARQVKPARVVHVPLALPVAATCAEHLGDSRLRRSRFVLAIGRLTTTKGILRLASIWDREIGPRFGLQLVALGSGHNAPGSVEAAVVEIARRSPWVTVREIGGFRERFEVIRSARFVVFAATSDVLPQALIETLAAGTPVIVTPIDAHLAVIRDDRTGFVLRDTTLSDLSTAIGRLMSDPGRTAAVARRAQEAAWREFAPAAAGKALLNVLLH